MEQVAGAFTEYYIDPPTPQNELESLTEIISAEQSVGRRWE